jgi:hypothetical protein
VNKKQTELLKRRKTVVDKSVATKAPPADAKPAAQQATNGNGHIGRGSPAAPPKRACKAIQNWIERISNGADLVTFAPGAPVRVHWPEAEAMIKTTVPERTITLDLH